MLSGEFVSTTRLLFQYMKTLSNIDKLRAFIVLKMIDLITFFDNNVKSAVYTGGNIRGIYIYIEIIEAPTTFATSGQQSHCLSPSCSINNGASTIQPVIAALH